MLYKVIADIILCIWCFLLKMFFERLLKVSPFTVLLLIGYFVYIQYNIIVVTSINVHLQQYNTSTLSIDLQLKN